MGADFGVEPAVWGGGNSSPKGAGLWFLILFRLAFWTFHRMIASSMTSEGIETNRTLEFLAWLEVNKKRVAMSVVAVVVVISAIATVQWLSREKQRRASSALIAVQLKGMGADEAAKPAASDYEAVARDYAGTGAAARAQLLAAELHFQNGDYERARGAFEAAGDLLKDEAFKAEAAYGVAASLDAMGRLDEAVAAYEGVTLRHATAAVAGQARLVLAGIQESKGDLAGALRSYSELTNNLASPWGSSAMQRCQEIFREHPEMAPAPSAAGLTSASAGISTNVVAP
ncbi:MAG: Tetratricopeptide repeat-like domain [Verrucomicrobiota bacterium]